MTLFLCVCAYAFPSVICVYLRHGLHLCASSGWRWCHQWPSRRNEVRGFVQTYFTLLFCKAFCDFVFEFWVDKETPLLGGWKTNCQSFKWKPSWSRSCLTRLACKATGTFAATNIFWQNLLHFLLSRPLQHRCKRVGMVVVICVDIHRIYIYIYMYIYLYLYVQYKLCPFKINRKPILVQDVSASTAWLFGSA